MTMKTAFLILLLVLPPVFAADGTIEDAIALYENGEYKQAESLLARLGESQPGHAELWVWLSRARLKTRQWDRAVQALEKAVAIEPANPRYRLLLGRACGHRASNSSFLTAMRWARRVVKEFETARSLAPENTDVRFDLLEYYLSAPGIVGGGKDKAEAEVRAIERLNPGMGYLARATVHIKDKKWDLARKELTRATEVNPQSASAHKDLAEFLFDRQDYEGALRYAEKARLLDGRSIRSKLLVAASQTRLRTGLEEAEETLLTLSAGRLGEGAPAYEEVYYWLGELYLAKGNKAKAREAFRSALTFDPEYKRAKDGLSKSRE